MRTKFSYMGAVWSAPVEIFEHLKALAEADACFDLSHPSIKELKERPGPRHFKLRASGDNYVR